MAEHILQASTSLKGEPQVVVRVSSQDDIAEVLEMFDAFQEAVVPKMKDLKSILQETDGLDLLKRELGGTVIQEVPTSPYPPQAPPPPAAPAVPAAPCTLGTRGAHAMACKHCAGPIGPREQLGQFQGHKCLSNRNCKPTWCN